MPELDEHGRVKPGTTSVKRPSNIAYVVRLQYCGADGDEWVSEPMQEDPAKELGKRAASEGLYIKRGAVQEFIRPSQITRVTVEPRAVE